MKFKQDFSSVDKAITFVPSQVPIPGDFLRVIYPPSRTRADVLLGPSAPSTGRQAVRSQDEVTMQAARLALADESKRFDDALGKRHQLLRGPLVPGRGTGGGATPAAIGMLDERLRELPVQGRNSGKGNPQSNGDMNGVEGAGDEPLLSPFDRNIDESRGAGWNSSGSGAKSATEASGIPSSAGVRMLERRLSQDTETDKDTGEKKSKSHKKSALMEILRSER
jgi:hypothetical protein